MGVREARLRREWAELYPGLDPDMWYPAAQLVPQVLRHRLQGRPSGESTPRILIEKHFEFRGDSPRDSSWGGILSRADDG
jgi:hypothetical protein